MKRFLYIAEIGLVLLAVLAAGTVGIMASSGGAASSHSPIQHQSLVSSQDYDSLLSGK